MLIAIQLGLIMQYTYYSLIGIGQLNPMFYNMVLGLKLSAGYQINLIDSNPFKNRQLNGIGITDSHAANNMNFELIFIVVFILIGGALALINKIRSKKQNSKTQRQLNLIKEVQQNPQSNKSKSNRLEKFSQVLIGNFGFGLFIFFLYKFFFSFVIQLKYELSEIKILDAITILIFTLILITFVILLIKKQKIFVSLLNKIKCRIIAEQLTKDKQNKMHDQKYQMYKIKSSQQKHNMINNQKSQGYGNNGDNGIINDNKSSDSPNIKSNLSFLQTLNNNPRILYPILMIISVLINTLIVIFCYRSIAWNACPICIYLLSIYTIVKFSFYSHVNQIRCVVNYSIAITMQALLIIRHLIVNNSAQGSIMPEQNELGMQIPYTIVALLVLLVLINFIYFIYSIKIFRCCNLQIEWQKISLKLAQKLKTDIKSTLNTKNLNDVREVSCQKQPSAQNRKNDVLQNKPSSIYQHQTNNKNTVEMTDINEYESLNSNRSHQEQQNLKSYKQMKKQIKQSLDQSKIEKLKQKKQSSNKINKKISLVPYAYTEKKYDLIQEYEKI